MVFVLLLWFGHSSMDNNDSVLLVVLISVAVNMWFVVACVVGTSNVLCLSAEM